MIRPVLAALCASLALSGPALAQSDETLRAGGNEPFWTAEVADDTLTLRRLGFEDLTLPVTSRTSDDAVIVIEAHDPDLALRAVLAVEPGRCNDTMSGMPFPATASISMGDNTMTGCAGDPRDLLTAQEWQVEDIGGAGIVDRSMVTLFFGEDGSFSGSSGCNRMIGGYELTGEGLTIVQVGTTMMACPDALMAQEMSVTEALQYITRFDIDETGALVLLGGDTPVMVARSPE